MRKRADDIRAKIKAEEKVLKDLNGTQCTLLRRCQLFINTSSITLRGVYEIDGELLIQPGGEEIAVFSFDQIDLGPEVNVTVVGQRPRILASRRTARFQTPFVVAPGTLGGFPGGYSVGSDPADVLRDDPRDVPLGDPQILDGTSASTNANGPGAPSVRVHLRSVRTEASDVVEIQRVTLAGDAGENLGGFWRLTYRDFRSRSLPPDASADLVRRACEEDLNRAHAVHRSTGLDNRVEDHAPGVGRCAVAKRRGVMGDDAAQWTLTFTSQIGAMELLGVEDHLTGMGANIRIERLQGGNSLGGTFALKFRGTATRPLAHDATSLAVARALVEDLPHVVAAAATRSDGDRVGGECEDGLCEDGPRPGGGLEWTLTLVTLDDVITPRAPVGYDWKGAPRGPLDGDVYDEPPTAAPTYDTLAPSYDTSVPSLKPTGEWLEPEGPCPNLTAAGALTGAGASVVARRGHFRSHRPRLAAPSRPAAFSVDRAARVLRKEGLVILPGLLDAADADALCRDALDDFERCRQELVKKGKGDLAKGDNTHNYRELAMREDLRCDLRGTPSLTREEGASRRDRLRQNEAIREIWRRAATAPASSTREGNYGLWNFDLGGPGAPKKQLDAGQLGAVVALPGCAAPALHAAAPHI